MIITERQKQIKAWLSNRKTPFSPFANLNFLQGPIDPKFHIEMEDESKKIMFEEVCSPPGIRSLQLEDIESVVRSRGDLPHWKLSGCTYFITICVENRVSKPFNCFANANIIEEAINHYHGKQCNVDNYIIMPDHIHLLMSPYAGYDFKKILQDLKRYTARIINQQNQNEGGFWQSESFDHLVRNLGFWVRYFDYIHNNPVKANIVKQPKDFDWSSLSKWYT